MDIEKKLYIYTRVSTEKQATESDVIKEQANVGIKLATRLGLEYEVFEEAGKSASEDTLENRPQLKRILEDVRNEMCKNLYCSDLTRLSRNEISQALICKDLKRYNVRLYTSQGHFDFSNPQNSFLFGMMNMVALYDAEIRKERFKMGYNAASAQGRFLKNIPPFGYSKNEKGFLEIDEAEKQVLLQIIEMYENGIGTNRIAAYLNANNIQTKTSKLFSDGYILNAGKGNRKTSVHKAYNNWNPGTINSLLKNTVLYGERKYKVDTNRYETVECPAIISKERWMRIQQIRINNAITLKKDDKYFYLLKGLLTCGCCGGNLHSRVKVSKGETTYKCSSKRFPNSGCKSRAISIPKLDTLVWDSYLKSTHYQEQINKLVISQLKDSTALQSKIIGLEKEMNLLLDSEEQVNEQKINLIKMYVNPLFASSMPQMQEHMEELNKKANEITSKKIVRQAELEQIKEQLENRSSNENDYLKLMASYNNAVDELSQIIPPFETSVQQKKAVAAIKMAIKNIVVDFDETSQEHYITIEYHPMEALMQNIDADIDSEDLEDFTRVSLEFDDVKLKSPIRGKTSYSLVKKLFPL